MLHNPSQIKKKIETEKAFKIFSYGLYDWLEE